MRAAVFRRTGHLVRVPGAKPHSRLALLSVFGGFRLLSCPLWWPAWGARCRSAALLPGSRGPAVGLLGLRALPRTVRRCLGRYSVPLARSRRRLARVDARFWLFSVILAPAAGGVNPHKMPGMAVRLKKEPLIEESEG